MISTVLLHWFLALLLQAFIDKFRYNAKRASLVQSRIKVPINNTIPLFNFESQTHQSAFLVFNIFFLGNNS